MDASNITENNADLWTEYLSAQWRAWLAPLGLATPEAERPARRLAEATAAGIASWLTMFVSQPIDAMYRANAVEVSRFVDEAAKPAARVEIPAQYAHDIGTGDATQREEWALVREPATALAR
jgi:hypothetical protein